MHNDFPGYEFKMMKDNKRHNMYRDVDVGKGGYVYSVPGMYTDVALLDIASMHPSSIIAMNCFGTHTQRFKDILNARVAIKHRDLDTARGLLDGKLAKYLDDEETVEALPQALKIAINSVYGLTSASFDNPFRDKRNVNNIVALRGALFMKTLQDEVEKKGYLVVHIKTDSIKIANADTEIIDFCMNFAKEYGYTFEHEATYDRMCLVNDTVYIAKYATVERCGELYGDNYPTPEKCAKSSGQWTATGTQFAVPYTFKKLFTKEDILFEDLCETKEVKKGNLYLDMNEDLEDAEPLEKELDKLNKKYPDAESLNDISALDYEAVMARISYLTEHIPECHNYIFVGRVGLFTPVVEGIGGGELLAKNDATGKYGSATGTKGYRWMESEMVKNLGLENSIDLSYYNRLADEAVEAIEKYGDFEWFVSGDISEAQSHIIPF